MKLTDIISKGNEIQDDQSCFFIAENDFSYKNLPILKNSLIFYGGKILNVNMMEFGVFQESNIPKFINGKLPEDEKGNYLVEKCSNCDFSMPIRKNFNCLNKLSHMCSRHRRVLTFFGNI